MKKEKSRVSICVKSFLLAIGILCFAEQYAYFNYPQMRSAHFGEDPVLFWVLARPYSVVPDHHDNLYHYYFCAPDVICNSYHMREKDDVVTHPSVMMLGDSCTYGFGLQQSESIPCCLEKILRKDSGVPFRVYNAGVPGYSSQQSLYFFKRLAPVYKPDIIIVADFYGDIGPDYAKDKERLLPEPLLTMKVLLWKSCAYRTLRGWFQSRFSSVSDKPMVGWRVPPDYYYANVQKIKELGKKYNSCLTIITYYPKKGSNEDDNLYVPYMKKLRDEHTTFVSLRKIWSSKREPQPDYFIDDIHFSAKGCEIVAGDLAEIIEGREEFQELCRRYKSH